MQYVHQNYERAINHLGDIWPLDAVRKALRVRSNPGEWPSERRQGTCWRHHYVMREIQHRALIITNSNKGESS